MGFRWENAPLKDHVIRNKTSRKWLEEAKSSPRFPEPFAKLVCFVGVFRLVRQFMSDPFQRSSCCIILHEKELQAQMEKDAEAEAGRIFVYQQKYPSSVI